jgi:hypothetical protein
MKPEYEPLYQDMLQDIERCLQLELPEKERIENCFWIAINYWEKLKDAVKCKGFKGEKDEIDFFRNVKPHFTSEIDYYVLLSEGLLFVPKLRESAIEYWADESRRFKRICDNNNEIVSYY